MIFKVNCSAVFNLETMLAAPGEVSFRQQSLLSMVKLAFVRRERSSCFKITLFSHYLTILAGPPPALQDLPDSLVSLYSHYGKVREHHLVCKLSQTCKSAQNTTIMWWIRWKCWTGTWTMPRVEGGGTRPRSSPRNRLRRWVSLGVKVNVGPFSTFTKLERNQGQYQVSSQDWCCFSDRNQILQIYLNASLFPVENWRLGRAKDTYRGASREIDGAAAKVCSSYYFFLDALASLKTMLVIKWFSD